MQDIKTAWIGGGSGFIGHHMARRLKSQGYWVRVVDYKDYEYGELDFCDEFVKIDLRDEKCCLSSLNLSPDKRYYYYDQPFFDKNSFDEVYCFACQMGGAGYVFTGEHDADIMSDSASININILKSLDHMNFRGKVFYSSSACIYPQNLQVEKMVGKDSPLYGYNLKESDAYPANPDSEYGWEKLFSERLYLNYAKNKNIDVRIARFHNIYGPEGTYKGGREKAPAAICRKVIAPVLDSLSGNYPQPVNIWGTGKQTRSFLYIDDCIDAVRLLMKSNFKEPINIGSEEMITINRLAQMVINISGKDLKIKNVDGPVGVMGRNSDNDLIRNELNWHPKIDLREGMYRLYKWLEDEESK